jgi:DNA-binding transcriptional LysR family regulator
MWFDERLISGVGVFASAVESGSFVAASELVGLTTSGVSRAVGRLEERLGVKLFHRTPKGIVPTSEGLRFYEQTVPLLHRLAKSADELRGADNDPVGLLTVRADASASLFLAHVTPDFVASYPQIDLRIDEEGSSANATDWDIRLYIGDEPSAHADALLDSETIVCASPAYLSRRGAPATPTDLTSSHTCLDQNMAVSRALTWRFSQTGLQAIVQTPNRISFSSVSTLMHAVLAGTGIGCMPRLLVDEALRSGRLVQVLPDWNLGTKSLFACAPAGQGSSARATALIGFLRDEERRLDQPLASRMPTRRPQPAAITLAA